MKCQRCREREANVQIVQQGPGKKPQTFMMCDVCAREMGISIPTFPSGVKLNNPFAVMGNAFQTTFGLGTEELVRRRAYRCDKCGLTFDEFRKTGFLGCPNCYEVFGSQLDPVFCRTQMGKKHLGRSLGSKMKAAGRKADDESEQSTIESRFCLDLPVEQNDETIVSQTGENVCSISKAQAGSISSDNGAAETDETADSIGSEELNALEKQHMEVLMKDKKRALEKAVAEEDYLLAARIRDEINELKKAGE